MNERIRNFFHSPKGKGVLIGTSSLLVVCAGLGIYHLKHHTEKKSQATIVAEEAKKTTGETKTNLRAEKTRYHITVLPSKSHTKDSTPMIVAVNKDETNTFKPALAHAIYTDMTTSQMETSEKITEKTLRVIPAINTDGTIDRVEKIEVYPVKDKKTVTNIKITTKAVKPTKEELKKIKDDIKAIDPVKDNSFAPVKGKEDIVVTIEKRVDTLTKPNTSESTIKKEANNTPAENSKEQTPVANNDANEDDTTSTYTFTPQESEAPAPTKPMPAPRLEPTPQPKPEPKPAPTPTPALEPEPKPEPTPEEPRNQHVTIVYEDGSQEIIDGLTYDEAHQMAVDIMTAGEYNGKLVGFVTYGG